MGEKVIDVDFRNKKRGKGDPGFEACRTHEFSREDKMRFSLFRSRFESSFKAMFNDAVVPNDLQESVQRMSCDDLVSFLNLNEIKMSEIPKKFPSFFAVYREILHRMGEWEEDEESLDEK